MFKGALAAVAGAFGLRWQAKPDPEVQKPFLPSSFPGMTIECRHTVNPDGTRGYSWLTTRYYNEDGEYTGCEVTRWTYKIAAGIYGDDPKPYSISGISNWRCQTFGTPFLVRVGDYAATLSSNGAMTYHTTS